MTPYHGNDPTFESRIVPHQLVKGNLGQYLGSHKLR